MKNIIKIIALKDLRLLIKNKLMIIPLIIIPFGFTVLLPIGLVLAAGLPGEMDDLEKMAGMLSEELRNMNSAQTIFYIGVNYYFPSLFLLIPIMSASIAAGNSFTSEREGKTMETLLYSPLTIRELFNAKIISSFVLAYSITLASFILFGIIIFAGQYKYFDYAIFPNLKWLIFIIWLCPSAIILGLIFMIRVSAGSKSYQEASQKVAFIIIPVIVLFIAQSSGLFVLDTFWMILIGAAIYAIDYILSLAVLENFVPEKLVN